MTDVPRPPGKPVRRSHWYDSPLACKQATHGIYIEIVVLALILVLEDKRHSDSSIVATMLGAILALVLAELYAYYVGTMIGTGRRPTFEEIRATVVGTAWSLVAAVPPILLLMLGVVGLISLDTGFYAAKVAGTVVIGLYSLLASLRAGMSYRRSLLSASVFLLVALGLVLLKHTFH
jgi:hypothetical protein